MYVSADMQAYAEGYHDGRADREYDNYFIDQALRNAYVEGWENGLNDRDEQDERN